MKSSLTLFILLALLLGAALTCLAVQDPLVDPVWGIVGLHLLSFVLLLALVGVFPDRWRPRGVLVTLFLCGLALRLLFLPAAPAADLHRCVWEGVLQTRGFNPYAVAPDDPRVARLAAGEMAALWPAISHKHLTAIYGPLAQLLFRLLAWIRPDPFSFKLAMLLADIVTLGVLAAIIAHRELPPPRLLLYAANPLVLRFIAGEGHLEGWLVMLLLSGVALVLKRHAGLGFFLVGCAAMVKVLAFFALPFLLGGRNWRRAPCALLPLLFYLPFLDAGSGLFVSLATFGRQMNYNDGLTAILRWALGGSAALPVAGLILLLSWGAIFLTVHDPLRGVFLGSAALLLCLPTLHPWYMCLVAPFAAAFASPSWLLLQTAAAATFPVAIHDLRSGVFREIPARRYWQYIPFYGLLAHGALRVGVNAGRRWATAGSISVVIPTLNEAATLGGCLSSLDGQTGVGEIIVADGGSGDDTRALAQRRAAKWLSCARGRGNQIAAGVRAASGDVVLVVHADCRTAPGLCARILDGLANDPAAIGGAASMAFATGGLPRRLIAALNNLRARLTGISFGDQCQFFRREALMAIGGFPAQTLMEDVELSLRLKERGRLLFLSSPVLVSGRRWESRPFLSNAAMVVRLCIAYLLQRRFRCGEGWVDRFYERYYGRTES